MGARRFYRLARLALRTVHGRRDAAWYAEQRAFLVEVAGRVGLPLRTVAAVVAALSPHVSWELQTRDIEPFLTAERKRRDTGRHAGFRANVVKARRILRGEVPERVLRGDKVRAFYRALLGDRHAIVIDRHMAAIVGEERALDKAGRYGTLASALRRVAARLGLAPADCQAMIWCYWRRLDKSVPF